MGSLPQGIAIVDFYGDGTLDLATANYGDGIHGTVSLLKGKADGTFKRMPDIPIGDGPVALAAGDFSGLFDSSQPQVGTDLAVANHAGYVTILFGSDAQGGNAQGENTQ